MPRKPAPKSKNLERSRKSAKNWKRNMKSSNKSKKYKALLGNYLALFSLFVGSFLLVFGFLTYKKINQSFASAYSPTSFDLRHENLFAIAFVTVDDLKQSDIRIDTAKVHLFDVSSNKHLEFDFDSSLELDVAGRYANEPLEKVLELGTSIHNDDLIAGKNVLNSSLSKKVGFNIDKFIVVDTALAPQLETAIFSGNLDSYMNWDVVTNLNDSMLTDLRLSEFYFIHKLLSTNTFDSDTVIAVSTDTTPEYIDSQIRDLTFDSEIAYEKKSVAVLNGTNHAGVAGFGSRIVENLGGRVVGVDNASQQYEKSQLIVDDKNSKTARALARYFKNIEIIEKSAIDDMQGSEFVRADIVLILGFDIVNQL